MRPTHSGPWQRQPLQPPLPATPPVTLTATAPAPATGAATVTGAGRARVHGRQEVQRPWLRLRRLRSLAPPPSP